MEIAVLTAFLTPFLPFLMKMGDENRVIGQVSGGKVFGDIQGGLTINE